MNKGGLSMRRIGKRILLFLTLTILLLELIPNFVFGFNVLEPPE